MSGFEPTPDDDGPEVDQIEEVIDKRLVAYSYNTDKLLLRFEDDTILCWAGAYPTPTDADSADLRDVWEEEAEWREVADE